MRVRTPLLRRVVPLPLLLSLVACKTWEPARSAQPGALGEPLPSSVRVTTADGARTTLRNPLFVNDSIVSAVSPPPGSVIVPPRLGVAEGDVNLIEVPRFSTRRTLVLVGAIASASIMWARVQGLGGGREPRPDPLPKDSALDLVGLFRFVLGSF